MTGVGRNVSHVAYCPYHYATVGGYARPAWLSGSFMPPLKSGNLVIGIAVVAVVGAAVLVYVVVRTMRGSERHAGGSGQHVMMPTRRFEVVVVGTFADDLQSYSGAAVCTPEGELLAWCGHRSPDTGESGLVRMRPPDPALKVFKCVGVGPEGFEFCSAEYVPARKTFYVFGGWGDHGPTNELYRLDLTRRPWTWEKIDAKGTRPSGRNGAPLVFDAPRHRLIVCGRDGGTGKSFRPLADCWQFDIESNTWAPLPAVGVAPTARWHAAMALDPSRGKAYLFGGAGNGGFDATLYELDLPTDAWRPVRTTGSPPPSLQGATFTFDSANGVLLLAGGLRHEAPGTATISTAWVFDPAVAQWDETDCGEDLRRRDHLGVYCRTTGEHLLIGGRISQTVGNFYDRGRIVSRDVKLKIRRVAAAN